VNPYTVLLLYPDYIADEWGIETYLAHVTADNPKDADKLARMDAAAAQPGDPDCDDDDAQESRAQLAADFHTHCIFEGHLIDLKP